MYSCRWTDSEDVDRQVREALAAGKGLYTVDSKRLAELKPEVIVTQVGGCGWGWVWVWGWGVCGWGAGNAE